MVAQWSQWGAFGDFHGHLSQSWMGFEYLLCAELHLTGFVRHENIEHQFARFQAPIGDIEIMLNKFRSDDQVANFKFWGESTGATHIENGIHGEMIDHLLSGNDGVDLARITAGQEDLVAVIFAVPKGAIAFFEFFEIAENGANGNQFLIHGADDADFHAINPLVM